MANILMCKRVDGAWGYITDGMVNALKSAGHNVERYDDTREAEMKQDLSNRFDYFHSFNPDLYIGCSGHKQYIPRDRSCKVAIHVNPYGPVKVEPNINESQQNIDWVMEQKPDAVFGYGRDGDRELWSYWEGSGVPWVPMPTAGDITRYRPDFKNYVRDLDLAYVGGRWTYKAESIDRFLVPLLQKSKLNYELWGWGSWPSVTFRGPIAEGDVPALFKRAKVGPCVSEPHTLVWGIDLPERVFKVILSGAVAVHDPVADMSSYLSSVTACFDQDDYVSTVKMICRWDAMKRLELAQKQYSEVCSKHTYHHRMARLFTSLGWHEEATSILGAMDGYIDDSCRQLQV